MRLPDAEPESDGPNLTPVIDVVFLLLIFFLVATQFAQDEREIETQLAEVAEAQPLSMPPKEVIVNVGQEGRYLIEGRAYNEVELSKLLHNLAVSNPGTQSVQIRADERVPFRYPARVMGLCQQEKIQHRCSVRLTE